MCISLCSVYYSFIKKTIPQLSPGGLADADWLFKLFPLYWSSVWKNSNRFILPKAKCFVLDELLRAECKRQQEKEAFLGWNYAWTNVVVWKILGSEVLGRGRAGVISCVLSELPTTGKRLVEKSPMDHSNLLNLVINCKLTFLESLYWRKLRPQCLHFEKVVRGVQAVNTRAQGMDKTHTRPVLLWNTYLQCSTGFRRGVIQLLIWLLPKPRNWVTVLFHFCTYIPVLTFLNQNSSLWGPRRGCSVMLWLSGWERTRVMWEHSEQP